MRNNCSAKNASKKPSVNEKILQELKLKYRIQQAVRGVAVPENLHLKIQQMIREEVKG